MMLNFAGDEKFFARMNFQKSSAQFDETNEGKFCGIIFVRPAVSIPRTPEKNYEDIHMTGSVMRRVVPRPGRDKIRICP